MNILRGDFEDGWAIGFWEGEGCVSLHKKAKSIEFSVAQKDKAPLLRFKAWLSSYNIDSRLYPVRSYEGYTLSVGNYNDISKLYTMMCYHLSDRRQDQFMYVIEEYRDISSKYRKGFYIAKSE